MLRALKKIHVGCIDIYTHDMYLNVCVCDKFLSCQKWQKNEIWDFSGITCVSKSYFVDFFNVNVILKKFQ